LKQHVTGNVWENQVELVFHPNSTFAGFGVGAEKYFQPEAVGCVSFLVDLTVPDEQVGNSRILSDVKFSKKFFEFCGLCRYPRVYAKRIGLSISQRTE
jgi:hypothetical protein